MSSTLFECNHYSQCVCGSQEDVSSSLKVFFKEDILAASLTKKNKKTSKQTKKKHQHTSKGVLIGTFHPRKAAGNKEISSLKPQRSILKNLPTE